MKLWIYFLPLLHLLLPFILLYHLMTYGDSYGLSRTALIFQSLTAAFLLAVCYTGFLLAQNTKRPTLWAVLIFIGTIILPWFILLLYPLVMSSIGFIILLFGGYSG